MPGKYRSAAAVPLDQAVGTVLAHDITEIRAGQFKGAAFKKGHIVTEEDLPHLRRLGKEHLFALNIGPGEVHEDDAAIRLAEALAGTGVYFDGGPSEGKISLKSGYRGLLKVNANALMEMCMSPDICCASRHNNTLVEKGEIIAAARAIPLVIDEKDLSAAIRIAREAHGLFSVRPLARLQAGIVITGNEVYKGLIEDKFASILRQKLLTLGTQTKKILYAPDDRQTIAGHIRALLSEGANLVLVSGGMSVDPDDVTRMAIADAGAKDLVYGTPVLPGAMFLYARLGDVPVLGLPACVIFHRATVLDLVLPRILAGETISRRDLAEMAYGGLCLNCEVCKYPVCPFGKA
ncbi:MAG: molybdopterin-binding protein [Desulfatiglandales bacterium]